MRRWAGACATLALGAVMLLLAGPPAGADPLADEQLLVTRLNALRASRGVPALVVDARLTALARDWSARMAAAGALSHNQALAAEIGGDGLPVGQNVGTGSSAGVVHDELAASAGHAANMVLASYTAVGVGVVAGGGGTWVTQVFQHKAAPAGTADPAPVPGPPVPPPGPDASGTGWYRLAGAGGETYAYGPAAALPRLPTPSPVVAAAGTPRGGWPGPPRARATASWPPTAASSPSATPPSSARPAAARCPRR